MGDGNECRRRFDNGRISHKEWQRAWATQMAIEIRWLREQDRAARRVGGSSGTSASLESTGVQGVFVTRGTATLMGGAAANTSALISALGALPYALLVATAFTLPYALRAGRTPAVTR